MTPTNIPPCPKCGVVPIVVPPNLHNSCFDMLEVCDCFGYDCEISTHNWTDRCNQELGRALRDLGIETVAQVNELADRKNELERAVEILLDENESDIDYIRWYVKSKVLRSRAAEG